MKSDSTAAASSQGSTYTRANSEVVPAQRARSSGRASQLKSQSAPRVHRSFGVRENFGKTASGVSHRTARIRDCHSLRVLGYHFYLMAVNVRPPSLPVIVNTHRRRSPSKKRPRVEVEA